jgi:hypothetical protein
MPITDAESAFVAASAQGIALSRMFAVTPSHSNPAYLVVSALDRAEYPRGSTGATGSFIGNGHELFFSSQGGDGYGTDIVFAYQPAAGLYYNATYGYFNQLVYETASSPYDVTNISVYGANSLASVTAGADNAWTLMSAAALSYAGSATAVTEPGYRATVPAQATPDSIASVAESFVGRAWNMNGCWTLASTVAAEAGTSLPVQSTDVGLAGAPNGEWIVAFNGPAGQTGNWQSMVVAGEMIVFLTAAGTGHITTCVSGSGSTAELVDNITYVNPNGTIANTANDGSSQDVTVAGPHPASQEFAGVGASSVVIYELDTPVVSDDETVARLNTGATLALATLFSVSDPAGRPISDWQIYDTAGTDSLSYGGKTADAHTAASAMTVASLSGAELLAGLSATTDTLNVRAFHGDDWGDWQSLAVLVSAAPASPSASPPLLAQQTANQRWTEGSKIALTMPAGTFTDPQKEAMTYTATQANGAAARLAELQSRHRNIQRHCARSGDGAVDYNKGHRHQRPVGNGHVHCHCSGTYANIRYNPRRAYAGPELDTGPGRRLRAASQHVQRRRQPENELRRVSDRWASRIVLAVFQSCHGRVDGHRSPNCERHHRAGGDRVRPAGALGDRPVRRDPEPCHAAAHRRCSGRGCRRFRPGITAKPASRPAARVTSPFVIGGPQPASP